MHTRTYTHTHTHTYTHMHIHTYIQAQVSQLSEELTYMRAQRDSLRKEAEAMHEKLQLRITYKYDDSDMEKVKKELQKVIDVGIVYLCVYVYWYVCI